MKTIITAIAAGTVLSFVGHTSALTLTGDVNMVFPPASVQANDRTNNRRALLFTEQANTVLTHNLRVEAYLAGEYNSSSAVVGRTLGTGRAITSLFLHADISDDAASPTVMSGSISFDQKILGVIFGDFRQSDPLVGAAGTAYEAAAGHGVDLGNQDSFRISNDRMRLDFDFFVSGITDQMRIILAGNAPLAVQENPIPEPVTPTLLAMGLGSLAMRRRHTA